ncbi:MAG: hypothetical protein DBX44_05955 [Oscillospiraceae bacterium]|nr:MAG: hypothetical protein DBX44_05955 [Oscillospiraceae bacterium]
MKQRIAVCLFVLLLVCLAGCAPSQESAPAPVSQAPVSEPASSEPAPYEPDFAAPQEPYWILGECAWGDGRILLYEERYPEEYNRKYSSTSDFYALRWQIFDDTGARIGEGDSGWSNSFALHDLPVTDLSAGDGLLEFWAEMPAEYSGSPLRRHFTLVVSDERLSILGDRAEDRRYQIEDWYPLTEEDGYRLETCSDYNWATNRSENRLLLTAPDGSERQTAFVCDDRDFWVELDRMMHPGQVTFEGEEPQHSALQIEMDFARDTVALSIPKLTVTVDFSTGETAFERHYTEAMLQTVMAESPDGRYTVYTAGEFSRFEAAGGSDYVVAGPDGAIRFLYAGSDLDQLAFLGSDRILANTFGSLICYDPAGEAEPQPFPFDYGEAKTTRGEAAPKYLTIGLAADSVNRRVLIAYRLNTFGDFGLEVDGEMLYEFPVHLAVYDFAGEKLADFDTGMTVAPFSLYTAVSVQIVPDGAGGAVLTSGIWKGNETARSVSVSYPI